MEVAVATAAAGRKSKQPVRGNGGLKVFQIGMLRDLGPFVIVESGTFELAVVQGKTKWVDEMEPGTGIGAQAYNVAGVGRNFGLVEDDVEHGGN